jgi:hypothetical protein
MHNSSPAAHQGKHTSSVSKVVSGGLIEITCTFSGTASGVMSDPIPGFSGIGPQTEFLSIKLEQVD